MRVLINKAILTTYKIDDESSFQLALINIKRELEDFGFNALQTSKFLTASSELARNILKYATSGAGSLEVTRLNGITKSGIKLVARDHGPGITDLTQAMAENYSSSGTLGQGLPGAKRLVDNFDIVSSDQGTLVTVISWL